MAEATKTTEKHLPLDAGVQAFREALAPQEQMFSRGVSLILNEKKDLPHKPHRGGTDTQSTQVLGIPTRGGEKLATKIAEGILDRNAKGQFTSTKINEDDPLWKV